MTNVLNVRTKKENKDEDWDECENLRCRVKRKGSRLGMRRGQRTDMQLGKGCDLSYRKV